jgi:photosynthetic reaction center cytochrome c subunit
METEQLGYRGTGMEQVTNPRIEVAGAADVMPAAPPPAPAAGPRAGDVYQNVQVLGDLSVGQFTRLMTAITEWVSPEEGCAYCHEGTDLASDDVYTKVVSRRMIEMTLHINDEWSSHVGATGVSCYTCHRGKNVPEEIWVTATGPRSVSGMAGWRAGQNIAAPEVGLTSLPYDPFARYLAATPEDEGDIRVIGTTALPSGTSEKNIKDTEESYSLMIHLSESLGVNCTYCHNSRAFAQWDESTPARENAWYGLRMVQGLNENFLDPLASALPAHRKSASGEAPKANCATCHQGVNKPLNGAPMLADFPELASSVSEPGADGTLLAGHGASTAQGD